MKKSKTSENVCVVREGVEIKKKNKQDDHVS